MNDLLESTFSILGLYVDNSTVYYEITTDCDISILQSDGINSISPWCNSWLMELNIAKCKSTRVSRNVNICPLYGIKSIYQKSVSYYKYLGAHITSNLSWKHTINF